MAKVDLQAWYWTRCPLAFESASVTTYIAKRAGSSVVATWVDSVTAAEAASAVAAAAKIDRMNFIFPDETGGGVY